MKIFLDTIDVDSIAALSRTGLVDGITTNPALLSKSERPYLDLLSEVCSLVKGPVSIEVVSTDADAMVIEALKLAEISENVIVKLPMTYDGMCACRVLSVSHQIKVNVTLCFSVAQAILAAKAGAFFISPFMGRLDDLSYSGVDLVREICTVYACCGFDTQVLAASVRSPVHVVEAAKAGAKAVTVPVAVFKQLFLHPLTDRGLEDFLNCEKRAGKSVFSK